MKMKMWTSAFAQQTSRAGFLWRSPGAATSGYGRCRRWNCFETTYRLVPSPTVTKREPDAYFIFSEWLHASRLHGQGQGAAIKEQMRFYSLDEKAIFRYV